MRDALEGAQRKKGLNKGADNMKQTVLANPGSMGVSFAGVTDVYQIIANVCMISERLAGCEITDEIIGDCLEREGLEITEENIAKVKAFF